MDWQSGREIASGKGHATPRDLIATGNYRKPSRQEKPMSAARTRKMTQMQGNGETNEWDGLDKRSIDYDTLTRRLIG